MHPTWHEVRADVSIWQEVLTYPTGHEVLADVPNEARGWCIQLVKGSDVSNGVRCANVKYGARVTDVSNGQEVLTYMYATGKRC